MAIQSSLVSTASWKHHDKEHPGGLLGLPRHGRYRTILAYTKTDEVPMVPFEIGEYGVNLVGAHLLFVFKATRTKFPG